MTTKKTENGFTIKYNALNANEFMYLWESVWGEAQRLRIMHKVKVE